MLVVYHYKSESLRPIFKEIIREVIGIPITPPFDPDVLLFFIIPFNEALLSRSLTHPETGEIIYFPGYAGLMTPEEKEAILDNSNKISLLEGIMGSVTTSNNILELFTGDGQATGNFNPDNCTTPGIYFKASNNTPTDGECLLFVTPSKSYSNGWTDILQLCYSLDQPGLSYYRWGSFNLGVFNHWKLWYVLSKPNTSGSSSTCPTIIFTTQDGETYEIEFSHNVPVTILETTHYFQACLEVDNKLIGLTMKGIIAEESAWIYTYYESLNSSSQYHVTYLCDNDNNITDITVTHEIVLVDDLSGNSVLSDNYEPLLGVPEANDSFETAVSKLHNMILELSETISTIPASLSDSEDYAKKVEIALL